MSLKVMIVLSATNERRRYALQRAALVILALLVLGAVEPRLFAVTMEGETYRVENGRKVDRTSFSLRYSADTDQVSYRKISGPDWIIPDGAKLNLIWKSKDRLRFVVSWTDVRYENDEKVWHPVILLDLDFSKPRFSIKTVGGFSDFDEIVSDPWQFEFRRTD